MEHLEPQQIEALEKKILSKARLRGGSGLQEQIEKDLAEAEAQEGQFLRERYLEGLLHQSSNLEKHKQRIQKDWERQKQQSKQRKLEINRREKLLINVEEHPQEWAQLSQEQQRQITRDLAQLMDDYEQLSENRSQF